MIPDLLFGFIVVCILIELTPGPNMAYLMILTLGSGRQAGFATVAGIALGLLIVGIASALGVATLITNSPLAYELLRWLGVGYLLWLAWCSWREDIETSPSKSDSITQKIRFFRYGLLVNILNPKAAVFYIAVLPGFIENTQNIGGQAVMLTLIYVTIATIVHLAIVGFAGVLRPIIDTPYRRVVVRRGLALLLGLVALWFGYSVGREN